jgi:hypothetical protein
MRRLDPEQIEFIDDFMTRVVTFLKKRIETGM